MFRIAPGVFIRRNMVTQLMIGLLSYVEKSVKIKDGKNPADQHFTNKRAMMALYRSTG